MDKRKKPDTATQPAEPPTDPSTAPPADDARVTALEAKYREFFREMGKEGEAVGIGQLSEVVARGMAREGYTAHDTGVGEVLNLVEEMIDSREEGDSIVVRFRVNGKDVESFKVGK